MKSKTKKSKNIANQVDPDKWMKYYIVWHKDLKASHDDRVLLVVKAKNVHSAFLEALGSIPQGNSITGIQCFNENSGFTG